VRYRFYVSTAALRGRMQKAGSVTRISAPEIEGLVEAALSEQLQGSKEAMLKQVKMITVSDGIIRLTLMQAKGKPRPIQIPWASKPKGGTTHTHSDCGFGSQARPKARKVNYSDARAPGSTTCLAGAIRRWKISPRLQTSIPK
jgi:hypothetical protein